MKKILISESPWQTRAAILHDNQLQDIYFDSQSNIELERCFFKAEVLRVIPGLQTAFVDIGQEKAGFLHISEVDRMMAAEKIAEAEGSENGEYTARSVKKVMNISKVFQEGESTLVQVIKEPMYEKGAKVTTCFTLPGKFIVLMPNIAQIGISKKIEDREERGRLRKILQMYLPKGMGAIVRTTSENRSVRDIKRDIAFLVALWHSIQKKFAKAEPGECLFTDLPLSLRVLREHLSDEVDQVLVNSKHEYDRVYKFVKSLTPEFLSKIKLYDNSQPLFDKYNIDQQVEDALQKKVHLKSGGSLIVETTEAMTVIDVNTGKYTGKDNMEETILKTNLEAADEVVRQLRLRNIGGLIVIDFIDMAQFAHRQKLSSHLEKTLKERDKFQSVTLKVSEFGLIQMTRKRSGKTLVAQLMRDCSDCCSNGFVKSLKTVSYELLDAIVRKIKREKIAGPYVFVFSEKVFNYIIESEHAALLNIEKALNSRVILECDQNLANTQFSIEHVEEV